VLPSSKVKHKRAIVHLVAGLCLAAHPRRARAVPLPFKNCGKAGDIVSIQLWDASSWPPVGVPAPVQGIATFDPSTGHLTNLQIILVMGTEWVFESGALDVPVLSGFVSLPAALPMNLVSPALPIPAGPLNATQTIPSSPPVTIISHITVGSPITSAVSSVGLTFNGMPGFPVSPEPGSYGARVQVALQSGQGGYCVDLALPNTPFVQAGSAAIPTLSGWALLALGLLLSSSGLLILKRRSS
jgi:hypothetical protein